MRAFIRVALELKHEHFDHVSIPRCGSQVNGLRAHMAVSVLGHGSLCNVIIFKLVPNRIKYQVGLFEADKLEDVHVVFEA